MNPGIPLRLSLLLVLPLALGCGGRSRSAPAAAASGGLTIAQVYEKTIASLRAGTPDTDGDGIPDDVERDLLRTDPLKVDSDGDGIFDNTEVFGNMTWGENDASCSACHSRSMRAMAPPSVIAPRPCKRRADHQKTMERP